MNIARRIALAAMIAALSLPALAEAEDRDARFFRELDADGDGAVTPQEFTLQKSVVLYMLDANHDLKLERTETRLTASQFQQYAGEDGVIDGLELFDLPQARFAAFDEDGDRRMTSAEFRAQLANLRGDTQTSEGR